MPSVTLLGTLMFLLTIINSFFLFFVLTKTNASLLTTTIISLLPFIIIIDTIFISIPTRLTYFYLKIRNDNSFIYFLRKKTNKTITRLILSVIFSLRSFEAKDIFTKITLTITLLSLLLINFPNNSYIVPILQSIVAAIIFDFIIIKIPQELKRQDSISVIKSTLHIILNGHMALRNLTIKNIIKDEGINNKNITTCINHLKSTNYDSNRGGVIQVSNSIKYMIEREKNNVKSKNDEIVFILKEIFFNIEKILSLNEINEFPELKKFLLNVGNIDIFSEIIKEEVLKTTKVSKLNLNERAESFVRGYLLPLEGVCYWYKRKAKRYIYNDNRKLINFNLESTLLFYTYDN